MTNVKEISGQTGGIVKWISLSDKNNSFCLEHEDKIWYVMDLDDELIENVLSKGDEIEFSFELVGRERVVSSEKITIISKANPKASKSSNVKEDWQDDMISFEQLLNEAHKMAQDNKYHLHINTQLIESQTNIEKGYAVVHATSTLENADGKIIGIYQAYGDATQGNCKSEMIKPHFLRMAETRAIARSLRWMTNNAATAKEEIGD